MDDHPDLRHLLDGPPGPAPVEDLQRIVKRAGRRTARIGAVMGLALLAAGGLGGYAIAHRGTSHTSNVATGGAPRAATVPAPSGGPASAGGGPENIAGSSSSSGTDIDGGGPYTHDFARITRGGASIRVFQPASQSADDQTRIVEVSTTGMVGTMTISQSEGIATPQTPLGLNASGSGAPGNTPLPQGFGPRGQVLGTAEGAPVVVVTAFTPASVTEVRWTGEGGGDAMAPSDNFVALAVPVGTAPGTNAAIGTLTMTNSEGHVIQTDHLSLGGEGCPGTSAGASSQSSCGTGLVCAAAGGSGGAASTPMCTVGSPPANGTGTCPSRSGAVICSRSSSVSSSATSSSASSSSATSSLATTPAGRTAPSIVPPAGGTPVSIGAAGTPTAG